MVINNKGFTLIELVIVTVIIGLLSLTALSSIHKFKERSETAVCKFNRQQLEIKYQLNQVSLFEADFTSLLEDSELQLSCPKGGIYRYDDNILSCSYHDQLIYH